MTGSVSRETRYNSSSTINSYVAAVPRLISCTNIQAYYSLSLSFPVQSPERSPGSSKNAGKSAADKEKMTVEYNNVMRLMGKVMEMYNGSNDNAEMRKIYSTLLFTSPISSCHSLTTVAFH